MTVKPIMKPMVARSVSRFVPLRASGMSSSTTTYIIAPAANASAKGKMGCICVTSNAPNTPAIGSTIPEACPWRNAFFLENPSLLRGTETAAPSGKF